MRKRIPYKKAKPADDSPGFERKKMDDKPADDSKPSFRTYGSMDYGQQKPFEKKPKPYNKEGFDKPYKKSYGNRSENDQKPFKRYGDDSGKKPYFKKEGDFNRRDDAKPYKKSYGDKPAFKKPFVKKEGDFSKPFGNKFSGGKRFEKPEVEQEFPYQNFENAELKKDKPKKVIANKEMVAKDDDSIRLNKYLSNAGIAARRKADELIKQGMVTVNGEVVTEMGFKVKPTDVIKFEGRAVKPGKKVYVLLNKPKDFITTTDDERDRKTVLDLVKHATTERIYPVGRLDRNTTGLLLLTNDGELADRLSHPRYEVKKIYAVELNEPLKSSDLQNIREGVAFEEGLAKVDDIQYVNAANKRLIGVEIHVGWNRIVRRIFETLGYDVVKLDRVMYAGLTKKDLPRGKWRFLDEKEVLMLKHFV